MDFMKVFDQTVREIKREVNLKVLKVPEIEQKVLDATDDEPWGPHGTVLAEIAQATKKYSECQMVMNVLWTRLTETGKNWRFVYKALTVIEYLVAHGSERAVDDIVEHTFQISSLSSFEYVESSGKDLGINVRKKAETIVALLNNKEKIQEARNKAAANRDKYFGLSSSGVTYKSGSASFTSGSFGSGDKYGGFSSEKDGGEFGKSRKDKDLPGEDKHVQNFPVKSRRDSGSDLGKTTKKKSSHSHSKSQPTNSIGASRKPTKINEPSQSSSTTTGNYDDSFDDFDPRGTFNSKPSAKSSSQVDLFGQNPVGDLLGTTTFVPGENLTSSDSSKVDLFADAAFVSATSEVGEKSGVQVDLFASQPTLSSNASPKVDLFATQPTLPSTASSKVDLFATQPAPASTASTTVDLFASQPVPSSTTSPVDFFATPDNATKSEHTNAKQEQSNYDLVDPFAAIPLNNFDKSDPFGGFEQNPANPNGSDVNATDRSSQSNVNGSSADIKPSTKKEGFQVKSGIWADSLSRGIIDLNITAPKKVNLADVGIVGGLADGTNDSDKGSSYAFNMGRSINTGSNVSNSGFSSTTPSLDDDFFSSLSSQTQHQHAGGFK